MLPRATSREVPLPGHLLNTTARYAAGSSYPARGEQAGLQHGLRAEWHDPAPFVSIQVHMSRTRQGTALKVDIGPGCDMLGHATSQEACQQVIC